MGRKRNTIVQLVADMTTSVQATVRFTLGNEDDRDFFAHLAYDPRIRSVWVASSHRSSLMALRIQQHNATEFPGLIGVGNRDGTQVIPLQFDQFLDFPILHPAISLGILVPDGNGSGVQEMERGPGVDPRTSAWPVGGPHTGDGEISMALVAYVIHSGGVDQVLIGSNDLEAAAQAAPVKLPPVQTAQAYSAMQSAQSHQEFRGYPNPGGVPTSKQNPSTNTGRGGATSPQRPRSPLSDMEEPVESVIVLDPNTGGPGSRKPKQKRDKPKDKSDRGSANSESKAGNASFASDTAIGTLSAESSNSLVREIQKVDHVSYILPICSLSISRSKMEFNKRFLPSLDANSRINVCL